MFESMIFRYHEVKHTNLEFEYPIDSFSLAQRACSMRMERQSGNGMGTERLAKDNGTRGWKATWNERMMTIPNHSWGHAWNDRVYKT